MGSEGRCDLELPPTIQNPTISVLACLCRMTKKMSKKVKDIELEDISDTKENELIQILDDFCISKLKNFDTRAKTIH